MNAFNPVFLLAGVMTLLTAQADGQGTLLLNNYDSAKGVWLIQNGATNPAPAGTMVQVLGGPDTNHLAPVTNSVGVSLYTIAAGDTNALGSGTGSFFDYGFGNVTGTTTNGTGMLQVLAWYGAATYAQATTRGATVAWSQTLGGLPPLPGLPTPRVLAMPAKLYMTSSGGAPTGSTNVAGGGQQVPLSGASYGCELWLEAERGTNALLLILHNTLPLQTYSVWSIGELTQTNWALETNVTGSCESATETTIPMNGRSELFLRASGLSACDTNFVFKGLAHASNTTILVNAIVPDTMGAVGPNHFVELLNSKIAVYDKCGTVITQTFTTNFFALTNGGTNYPTGNTLDGRILYDLQSKRWIACALDGGSHQLVLSISKGDDPSNLASGWTNYLVQVARNGLQTDTATLGLDVNGIYLRVLQYGANSSNAGHTVVAIKKPEIYQGSFLATTLLLTNGLSLQTWTIQPALNFDSVATNGYAWFVAKGPPDWSQTNNPGGPVWYRRLQWQSTNATWADTDWVALTNTVPTYQDYYDLYGTNTTVLGTYGPYAPDPGTTNAFQLFVTGSRLTSAVIRDQVLWTCQAIGLKGTNGVYVGGSSATNMDRSGIQWLKFAVSTNTWTLSFADHGRFYDPAATNPIYYYVPSLMVNSAGDVLAGFSGSSTNVYISAYYDWHLANGSTLAQPVLVQAGSANWDNPTQWGDYSATMLDPSDEWTFWTVQAYTDSSQHRAQPWATVIGRILPP